MNHFDQLPSGDARLAYVAGLISGIATRLQSIADSDEAMSSDEAYNISNALFRASNILFPTPFAEAGIKETAPTKQEV